MQLSGLKSADIFQGKRLLTTWFLVPFGIIWACFDPTMVVYWSCGKGVQTTDAPLWVRHMSFVAVPFLRAKRSNHRVIPSP